MYFATNPGLGATPLTRILRRAMARRGLGQDELLNPQYPASTIFSGGWDPLGNVLSGKSFFAGWSSTAPLAVAPAAPPTAPPGGTTAVIYTDTSGNVLPEPPAPPSPPPPEPGISLSSILQGAENVLYNMGTGHMSPFQIAAIDAQTRGAIHRAAGGNVALEAAALAQWQSDLAGVKANAPGFGGGGAGPVGVPIDYTPYVVVGFVILAVLLVAKS